MKTINGQILKEMLISGANNLHNHYPEVDALNVFPVPDGDTGMNMNLTTSSGAKAISTLAENDVYVVATTFSKRLLMAAQGNSGVITSQIFRGFAQYLEGKSTLKGKDIACAFENGSVVAYKAVMRPVEGTMLTVIREASEGAKRKIKDDDTVLKAMEIFLSEAKISLKHTPELLPVLKEVGVVDSGGAGLVKIFEGMISALKGKTIERDIAVFVEERPEDVFSAIESDEFGYCTEFIMRLGDVDEKKPFMEKRFKTVLESHGNSIAVVIDEEIVKVHIHTLKPGGVLQYAQRFGEFIKVKIENMSEQHSNLTSNNAPVKSTPKKEYGIVSISSGKGIDDVFTQLGVSKIVNGGQTMNPSTEDIISAVKSCDAKKVFVLPNNSNIIMSASQAADVLSGEIEVCVIPTKTIPQGIAAVTAFNEESSLEENNEAMNEMILGVTSGSITYSIKDTVIDGVSVTKNHFMGIHNKTIVLCEKDKMNAFYKLLDKMITEDSAIVTVILGEDITTSQENAINKKLINKYKTLDIDIIRGDQPVYSFLIGIE